MMDMFKRMNIKTICVNGLNPGVTSSLLVVFRVWWWRTRRLEAAYTNWVQASSSSLRVGTPLEKVEQFDASLPPSTLVMSRLRHLLLLPSARFVTTSSGDFSRFFPGLEE